jgi:hypothetical protein
MSDIILLNVRVWGCLLFLCLSFILIFMFIFTRKPITKIVVLAFTYNIILFFLMYNIFLFKVENSMFNFIVLVIFSCLLDVLTGIFVINNVIKNSNAK